MEVVVYGPLRSAVGGKRATVDVDAETIEDVLRTFVEAYPRSADQLYTDDGTLRPSVRIMCDGEPVKAADPYPAGGDLALFPAMQGG